MTLRQSQGPCKFCIAYIALTFFALIANLHILCPGFNALSDDWSARKLAWLLETNTADLPSLVDIVFVFFQPYPAKWKPCTKSLAVQLLPNIGVYYHPIVWRVKENLTDLLQSTSACNSHRCCAAEISAIMKWSFLRSIHVYLLSVPTYNFKSINPLVGTGESALTDVIIASESSQSALLRFYLGRQRPMLRLLSSCQRSVFGPALLAGAMRQCIAQTVFGSCLIRLIEAYWEDC